jgi:hypothetical protein
MAGKAIYAGLLAVQRDLKAPKDKSGGKYQYRSAEDILEKVKPLLTAHGLILLLSEELKTDAVGSYIVSKARLIDIASGDELETQSMAREDVGTKFMSPGQATGATVSYARKYTLGGMFMIDNEKDIDSLEYQEKRKESQQKPSTDVNGGQDAIKKAAVKGLNEKVKELGISNTAVTKIIPRQYNQADTGGMTTGEIAHLANNLKRFIDMGTGA